MRSPCSDDLAADISFSFSGFCFVHLSAVNALLVRDVVHARPSFFRPCHFAHHAGLCGVLVQCLTASCRACTLLVTVRVRVVSLGRWSCLCLGRSLRLFFTFCPSRTPSVRIARRIRRRSACHCRVLLVNEGYIGEFEYVDDHRAGKIVVNLIGRLNKCGVISPRFDVKVGQMENWVNNLLPSRQFGYIMLTTSYGIMDHEEARTKHTGGKILGFFY